MQATWFSLASAFVAFLSTYSFSRHAAMRFSSVQGVARVQTGGPKRVFRLDTNFIKRVKIDGFAAREAPVLAFGLKYLI